MDPCELTALITAAANSIAGCTTDEELAILCTVLTQLADTLATILAVRSSGQ